MLAAMVEVVKQTGQHILALQRNAFASNKKTNHNLASEADLLANQLLYEKLLPICPNAAWLSEESHDDKTRLHKRHVFIVDPIDGSREYAMHLPEYAISVALIYDHQPVLAVVFNPATDECYYAEHNQGAWLDGKRLHCKMLDNIFHLLVSRSEYDKDLWQAYTSKCCIEKIGSIAYKMALIAAGKADATVSLYPKNEWDIAAGTLLVREAGGIVTNGYSKPMHFNNMDTSIDGIMACSPARQLDLLSMLKRK